jgi:MoxR-like ATPase
LLIWQRIAQAWAFLRQRPFVTPDDVQQVALPVLGVRLGTASDATTKILKQIVESVPVPV